MKGYWVSLECTVSLGINSTTKELSQQGYIIIWKFRRKIRRINSNPVWICRIYFIDVVYEVIHFEVLDVIHDIIQWQTNKNYKSTNKLWTLFLLTDLFLLWFIFIMIILFHLYIIPILFLSKRIWINITYHSLKLVCLINHINKLWRVIKKVNLRRDRN